MLNQGQPMTVGGVALVAQQADGATRSRLVREELGQRGDDFGMTSEVPLESSQRIFMRSGSTAQRFGVTSESGVNVADTMLGKTCLQRLPGEARFSAPWQLPDIDDQLDPGAFENVDQLRQRSALISDREQAQRHAGCSVD